MCVHPWICVFDWTVRYGNRNRHSHNRVWCVVWYQENKYRKPIDTNNIQYTCDIIRRFAVRDSRSASGLYGMKWDWMCVCVFDISLKHTLLLYCYWLALLLVTRRRLIIYAILKPLHSLVIGHLVNYRRYITVPGWSLPSSIDSNWEGDGEDNSHPSTSTHIVSYLIAANVPPKSPPRAPEVSRTQDALVVVLF